MELDGQTKVREERDDTHSAAAGRILQFIRDRRYEPLERLPSERELAEKFKMGRGAIREALSALEALRVVERRPNSGIYLRNWDERSFEALVLHAQAGLSLDRNEILDAIEVRRLLEVEAVKLACQRRTDADVENIREILQKMKERIRLKETIEEEDLQFHLSITAASKNEILSRIVNTFFEISERRRKIYFSYRGRSRSSYDEHAAIFDALVDRDKDLAGDLMNRHLTTAAEAWAALLGDASLAGPGRVEAGARD
jgi:DNA-binding FadR family transcriptional regulator